MGRVAGWWRTSCPGARRMPVPSSYNDVLVDPGVHDHVGDVWYQRTAFIPRGWAGNGSSFGSTPPRTVPPRGSATPESASTKAATRLSKPTSRHSSVPGEEFRLTVVVNNELTWESIPPGIVEVLPDGTRRQRQYHDFFNYAGLHRSVWLYSTPPAHIADVTVVTDIEEGPASFATRP